MSVVILPLLASIFTAVSVWIQFIHLKLSANLQPLVFSPRNFPLSALLPLPFEGEHRYWNYKMTEIHVNTLLRQAISQANAWHRRGRRQALVHFADLTVLRLTLFVPFFKIG